MSIYSTPLWQIGAPDLQELLNDRAVENARLEFKLLTPGKEETLKKLSSFANTYGGLMVIGAKADSADGRIQDLPGVDVEAGYKQKIMQWCFDGVSPPLVVEVSDPIPVPSGGGGVCYVAHAAESDVAPHFLNGRKGLWVRTDEFSARFEARLADENELRHLFDRRRLVRERRERLLERARKRFGVHVAKIHTTRTGDRTESGPTLEISMVPRFPSRQLCEQAALEGYIQNSRRSWRGVTFPDPGSSILSQHESGIVLNAAVGRGASIFGADVWGTLFYGVEIGRQQSAAANIHLPQFVGDVLISILHAGGMLGMMGYSGSIVVDICLTSVLGIGWLLPYYDHVLAPMGGSELDDRISFSIGTTGEALRDRPDGVAMDVLRVVLFSVNLSQLVRTKDKLEDLVRAGYEFNRGSRPDSLRV